MAISSNLGYPRIGQNRQLKFALEQYWQKKTDILSLKNTASQIREENWLTQKQQNITHIPSNDFSLYDQVLDTTALLGAIPKRFKQAKLYDFGFVTHDCYFAMARGFDQSQHQDCNCATGTAMQMTKWFDTNYHYIVPEFEKDMTFELGSNKPIDEFKQAKALGIHTRPVLLGPISYLLLGNVTDTNTTPLDYLDKILPIYQQVLNELQSAGATWIQIDEPILSKNLNPQELNSLEKTYAQLSKNCPKLKILIATYFSGLDQNLNAVLSLPIQGLHIDTVTDPNWKRAVAHFPEHLHLSLGLVNGRNIWKTSLKSELDKINYTKNKIDNDKLIIAPSCSLLHSPVDLKGEKNLNPEIKSWLAFAKQKLIEITTLTNLANQNNPQLPPCDNIFPQRHQSNKIHKPQVQQQLADITPLMYQRQNPFDVRIKKQIENLNLPLLPTTTIGSFPQTPEIRKTRAQYKKKIIDDKTYQTFIRKTIQDNIKKQEKIGLDVLVHGEPERNDMVEFFSENLEGFIATQNGWVQSYGSRCVKPPIIYGDIQRKKPMTVELAKFAQSCTDKPVKAMLTGPVTILQWSFVRDDQSRKTTCTQIALAIRDEVTQLQDAGIKIIQIDEPALREGLPIKTSQHDHYFQWAVDCFKLATSSVDDATQIHTHMCYSEFDTMIQPIANLDPDVISIESSRAKMTLLDTFANFKYPNQIGPGIYDIHSPQIPAIDSIIDLLQRACYVLKPQQLWVNPDCGLKTRTWQEVLPSLENMTAAAKQLAQQLQNTLNLNSHR